MKIYYGKHRNSWIVGISSFTSLWTKPPHPQWQSVSSEFVLQELWWEVLVRSEQYTHLLVSCAPVWSQMDPVQSERLTSGKCEVALEPDSAFVLQWKFCHQAVISTRYFVGTDQSQFLVAQGRCLKRGTPNKEIPGQLHPYNLNSPCFMWQYGQTDKLKSGVLSLFVGSLFCYQMVAMLLSSHSLRSDLGGVSAEPVVNVVMCLL